MPELNVVTDDISGDYARQRQDMAQKASSAELDLLLSGLNQPQAANSTPAPSQPQPAAANPQAPKPAKADGERGVLQTVGAVASDIGRGVVDAPGAIVKGSRDAVQEVLDLSKSLSDWLDSNLGTVTIGGDDGFIKVRSPAEMQANPSDPITVPDTPESFKPDSVTGSLIKGVAQFLTGFKGAGVLMGPVKAASGAAKVGKAMAQGAVADMAVFDPHEARLSNLIQAYPALQNPVSEYLASDPADSEAEGRFKNAIEGLGLGAITDGFSMAVKTIRGAAVAKRMEIDAARTPGGEDIIRPEVDVAAFDATLGDVNAPAFSPRAADDAIPAPEPAPPKSFGDKLGEAAGRDLGVPDDVAAKGIHQPVQPESFINFSRIESTDDIKNVMQQMADAYKPDIDAARRGEKRGFAQMELDAEHVNAFETLMSRREGSPLNAEQSVAARQLWASSADKLSQTARMASADPSEANLFAFRKMMATHQAIQAEVIAARTETARALASWRIPTGSGAQRFMEIDNALRSNGGADLSREMAQRVAALADNGMIHEMDGFISKAAFAKTRDAMLEAWINWLLSGPKTHLVNAMSNTSVVFQQMYERHTASKIASFLGDEGSVQVGEATAQLFGMMNGLRDAFRYAGKSFITGESGFGLGKVELPSAGAISSEAFEIPKTGFLGRTADLLGTYVVRVPGRSLAAADEFFKTIGYRMELNALALRTATQEVNAGKIPADQLKPRIAEILQNPPDSVRLSAIDQATYQTFTNKPGELADALMKVKGKFPAFNIIMPFVRTPANIMRYTFERSPLAPLMKQVRSDVAAGGARRDLALARISTGTSIMLVTADMAMSGEITGKGPSNSAERQVLTRLGWQPYSVKVGDRYYAYNRMDPLGMTMGLAADMAEITANDDFGPEKEKTLEEAGVAIALSIANNAMSKTYMSGLSEFFEAMSDPTRNGESYFQRLAGSLVPTAVAEAARFNDPYMREANTMLEAMRRRTPGLSDSLPLRRNLWGEPISYQSGLGEGYDLFSPIYSKSKVNSPIDEEILKQETSLTMPAKKTSFDGITINLERHPEAYSRYTELAGNGLKHPAWNLGARDLLNQIVSGKHVLSQIYEMRSDGPEGGKSDYIKKIINQYRELARDQVLKEFPEIKARVEDGQEKKRELKLPTIRPAGDR